MKKLWADPVRRGNLIQGAVVAAVIALLVGGPAAFIAFMLAGSAAGLNVIPVVFWIIFLIMTVGEAIKSDAVLEFERRCRYAEEMFKRNRS